ncbi:MAG: succinylglutamate desuccinylase/aspartoacylase family protein [Phaeodactylibacter sp.]|nr:succinylglutamate desuccinylase/aspartoacylase family protein [Phaeodactylibacter sp.]
MSDTSSQLDAGIQVIEQLDLAQIPSGTINKFYLHLVTDGVGQPVYVPIMVAKGVRPGKVLGVTAAVHGNELNGIPVIQRFFRQLNVADLEGIVVGVLIVNVPSLLRRTRRFIDGVDLNHIMPGRKDGAVSEIYAYRIVHRIIRQFDYLLDLHTASFGRVNSYYIRADLKDPVTRQMALLQNAQIAVNNFPSDGTLRGAAEEMGIHAITLEVGNPNTFQKGMIRDGLTGIHNLLGYLGMLDCPIEEPAEPAIICRTSYWIYSDEGGILNVLPQVTQMVEKGELIATIKNVFGDLIKEYFAPETGVVIGKEVNPINQTGGRILHLGIPEDLKAFQDH